MSLNKNKYPDTRDDLQSTGGKYSTPSTGLMVALGLVLALIIITIIHN